MIYMCIDTFTNFNNELESNIQLPVKVYENECLILHVD